MPTEFHPIAEIFPRVTPKAYFDLECSILKVGLREPIWTHEGVPIDGRARLEICQNHDIQPRFNDWQHSEIVAEDYASFLCIKNQLTRTMSCDQRAISAALLVPFLEEMYLDKHLKSVSDSTEANDKLVYFVEAVGLNKVKIGVADDPHDRLRRLRLMSPVELRLITSIPGGFVIEKRIHTILRGHRSHGEWFHMSTKVVSLIARVKECC